MTPERFAELCELAADGDLAAEDDRELRERVERDPEALAQLRRTIRQQLQCRVIARAADRHALARRVEQLLRANRASRRQHAARSVMERIASRRRRRTLVLRWSIGLVAAALLALALLPVLGRTPALAPADPCAPRIAALDGAVGQDGLRVGDRIGRGMGIAGTCTLEWDDGSRAQVAGEVRRPDAAGQSLELRAGRLVVEAAHRPEGDSLVLRCPDAEAIIVGTRFALAVADGRSVLMVEDGLVRWTRSGDGASSEVGAGQRVPAASLPLPRPVLTAPARLQALRADVAAGREPWRSAAAALRQRAGGDAAQPAVFVALACVARLERDASLAGDLATRAAAALRARIAAGLVGDDRRACEYAAAMVVAGDLLRGTPAWDGERDLAALLEAQLPERIGRLRAAEQPAGRWWGIAAAMAHAAWRGDASTVARLRAGLVRELAVDLAPGRPRDADALAAAALALGIARTATDADPRPPPAWDAHAAPPSWLPDGLLQTVP